MVMSDGEYDPENPDGNGIVEEEVEDDFEAANAFEGGSEDADAGGDDEDSGVTEEGDLAVRPQQARWAAALSLWFCA